MAAKVTGGALAELRTTITRNQKEVLLPLYVVIVNHLLVYSTLFGLMLPNGYGLLRGSSKPGNEDHALTASKELYARTSEIKFLLDQTQMRGRGPNTNL